MQIESPRCECPRWIKTSDRYVMLRVGLPNLEDLFITSSGINSTLRHFPTTTLQELTFLWKDCRRGRHDPEGSTSIGALLGGLDGQPKIELLRVCDDTFHVDDRDHHALVLPALEQLIIKSTLGTIAAILSCLTILPSMSAGIKICSPATSHQEVTTDGLSTPQDEQGY